MRRDAQVNRVVQVHTTQYTRVYRPLFVSRYNACHGYYTRWGTYYRPWYRYGFYGGWYWGLRPVYDIHVWFYNPIIFWLYADRWDDYYYQRWYGSDYYSYPHLRLQYPRPGAFYPTEALRDLSLGVSVLPARQQANFRYGLVDLTTKLEAALTERVGYQIQLGRNDIVVTHYQMLDGAVSLDGYVAADAQQFPFKALIDFDDPNNNFAFIPPATGGEPNEAQVYELRRMNERIEQLGGTNEFPEQPVNHGGGRRGDLIFEDEFQSTLDIQ